MKKDFNVTGRKFSPLIISSAEVNNKVRIKITIPDSRGEEKSTSFDSRQTRSSPAIRTINVGRWVPKESLKIPTTKAKNNAKNDGVWNILMIRIYNERGMSGKNAQFLRNKKNGNSIKETMSERKSPKLYGPTFESLFRERW